MREGLDQDDIYIMVEDEFQAVARMFTQHLHHAEYLRLKNLVKSQNASTIQSISRPVDPRTTMRPETRKKIVAETLQKGMKKAVHQLKLGADSDGNYDPESDLDVDKEDDPWVGTSLQSLMTSPRRSQNSLTGITGIKSGSRAAAGYLKAKPRPEPKISTSSVARSNLRHSAISQQDDEAPSSEEDDDLDAPTFGRAAEAAKDNFPPRPDHQMPSRPSRSGESLFAQFSQPKKPPDRKGTSVTIPQQIQASSNAPIDRSVDAAASQKVPSKRSTSTYPTFDDLPEAKPKPHEMSHRIGRRMAALKAEKAQKEREQKRKATSLNEIPTFLV